MKNWSTAYFFNLEIVSSQYVKTVAIYLIVCVLLVLIIRKSIYNSTSILLLNNTTKLESELLEHPQKYIVING